MAIESAAVEKPATVASVKEKVAGAGGKTGKG